MDQKKIDRLQQLYNIVESRTYLCGVAPMYLYTEDDIRLTGMYGSGNVELDSLIDQTKVRKGLTIMQMAAIIDRISEARDMELCDLYKDAIPLYDVVREYISLWADIIQNHPNARTPPLEFFEQLDKLAEWAFANARLVKAMKPEAALNEHDEQFTRARRRVRRINIAREVPAEQATTAAKRKVEQYQPMTDLFSNRIRRVQREDD